MSESDTMSAAAAYELLEQVGRKLSQLDKQMPGEPATQSSLAQLRYIEPYLKAAAAELPKAEDLNFGLLGMRFVRDYDAELAEDMAVLAAYIKKTYLPGEIGSMPPAARVADPHVCPMVTGIVPHVGGPILPPGEPTVLIGGMPAARATDKCVCVGPIDMIAKGSAGVMIGKLPAARLGDPTVHGGVIVFGLPTVIIGEVAGGGGGGGDVGTGSTTAKALEEVQPGDLKAPASQAAVLKKAAADGTPFCEECSA